MEPSPRQICVFPYKKHSLLCWSSDSVEEEGRYRHVTSGSIIDQQFLVCRNTSWTKMICASLVRTSANAMGDNDSRSSIFLSPSSLGYSGTLSGSWHHEHEGRSKASRVFWKTTSAVPVIPATAKICINRVNVTSN